MNRQFSMNQRPRATRRLWRTVTSSLLLLGLSVSTGTAATFTKVLDTFDTLPGAGAFRIRGGPAQAPALDAGKVAFFTDTFGGISAVWVTSLTGGTPIKLVDSNTTIPAGTGNFGPEFSFHLRNSRVVFRGDDNGEFGGQNGYYGVAATGGVLTKLIDKNTLVPGGGGSKFLPNTLLNFNVDGPNLVFEAGNIGAHQGVFTVPTVGGAVAPVDGNIVICEAGYFLNKIDAFASPDVSGSQVVAGVYNVFGHEAIYLMPRSGLTGVTDPCAAPALKAANATRIASANIAVPGDPLARKFDIFSFDAAPLIDGTTIILQGAATRTTGQTYIAGLYGYTPTTGLRKLVDTTTLVPGGTGTFRTTNPPNAGHLSQSYTVSGTHVVFVGTDATGRQGLYHVAATGGAVRKVIAINDTVGVGRKINNFHFAPIQTDSLHGARLAFRADFFDTPRNAQGSGIFVTNAATGSAFASIGVFQSTARWYLDADGSGTTSGCPSDDCLGPFGVSTDIPVVGRWNGVGNPRLGTFSPATRVWRLDLNGNGVWNGVPIDRQVGFGIVGDLPVVGDWTGTGITRIGVFRPSTGMWYLDKDNDGLLEACAVDLCFGPFGGSGDRVVAGDWSGNGKTKIGVYRASVNRWIIDYNGDGKWNGTPTDKVWAFGLATDQPVVGDWTGDGKAKIGMFRPSTERWYLDANGSGAWNAGIDLVRGPFGTATDKPVVGAW